MVEGLDRVQVLVAEYLPATPQPPPERRVAWENLMANFPPPSEAIFEPVNAGGVPGAWVTSETADPFPITLYLHGGAYGLCSVQTHANTIARIALASGGRALGIDYRLAPEHPFPAAVEDSVAAYRWLLQQGVNPSQIVVAGDSGGAGLALALVTVLRDAGEPIPAGVVASCPWIDLADTSQSAGTLPTFAANYLAGADPTNPLASPIYADCAGWPPLLILAGGADGLLPQAEALADMASAAGVDVELDVWPAMPHVWHLYAGVMPDGDRGNERIGAWIRARALD
jgi:acetyl esterase/lipase